MISTLLRTAPALATVLALTACDQPKWREGSQGASGDPASAPATSAPAVRQIPADTAGTPATPEWAKPLVGKTLREAFPKTGICKGNTDIIQKTYAGTPQGVQVHGWGWDDAKKARIERVVLVDKDFQIVGGGQGGVARPDVPTGLPEISDAATGWNADLPLTAGPLDAYGIVGEGDAVCVLGHIAF
ncbi:MAG: hypothetical protein U1C74_06495 [Phenylobacterium sp.]|nr:hypothetical protein [Phenylobacterium sp.]